MNKPVLIGILLFFVVLALFVFLKDRPSKDAPVSNPVSEPSAPKNSDEPESRRIQVQLFFFDPTKDILVPEERMVTYRDTIQSQAKEILQALIDGPTGNLAGTIPEGTEILDVFFRNDGTAYVDFSPQLSENHRGGTDGEIQTIYSIVNTLTLNLPTIKRVQILVGDHALDTLKGHIDLSRPLKQDLRSVRLPEGG